MDSCVRAQSFYYHNDFTLMLVIKEFNQVRCICPPNRHCGYKFFFTSSLGHIFAYFFTFGECRYWWAGWNDRVRLLYILDASFASVVVISSWM